MTPIRATALQVAAVVPPGTWDGFTAWPRLLLCGASARVARAELTRREWRLITRAVLQAVASVGHVTTTVELGEQPKMTDSEDVPAAHGVRLRHENGGCLVEFLDASGVPFAVADFEPEKFSRFIGEACDLLEIVSKGGLAVVECRSAA